MLDEYNKNITPSNTAPNIYTKDVKLRRYIPIEETIKATVKNIIWNNVEFVI